MARSGRSRQAVTEWSIPRSSSRSFRAQAIVSYCPAVGWRSPDVKAATSVISMLVPMAREATQRSTFCQLASRSALRRCEARKVIMDGACVTRSARIDGVADDAGSDVSQLGVLPLGGEDQEFERLALIAPLGRHEDAFGLLDDGTARHRFAQALGEGAGVPVRLGVGQDNGGLGGER